MNKHHDLMTLLNQFGDFIEYHFIHIIGLTLRPGLPLNTEEVLFEGDGTKRCVKEEETLVPIDSKEIGDIDIIGECGGETDNTDEGLT
jgi:hypothetical protein